MSMTDPVADMLTRLRNAILARKSEVIVPKSNLKERVANILREEGFLEEVSSLAEVPSSLRLKIRYAKDGRRCSIREIHRVSKPGQRRYAKTGEIPRVCSGLGISILSTSRGVVSDRQARKRGVGGEILCEVW